MRRYEGMPADMLYGFQIPEYDSAAKRLLSKKKILAYILKRTIPEFALARYQDIVEQYIEGEPEIGTVPVDRDMTNAVRLHKAEIPEIRGNRNEDISPAEGTISFDILFRAKAPVSDELITLIINIEAQKQYELPYPLMKRAVYYAGRLISSQKGVKFTNSDYGRLKKIYTIWLCLNGPAGKNAINRYEMMEKICFAIIRRSLKTIISSVSSWCMWDGKRRRIGFWSYCVSCSKKKSQRPRRLNSCGVTTRWN